jgi:hypothetical protein
MFIGWMQGEYGPLLEMFGPDQVGELWRKTTIAMGHRFRSEVLRQTGSEDILTDGDLAAIAEDVNAFEESIRRRAAEKADEILTLAVQRVRAGQASKGLPPDPRSDDELKEAIKAIWSEEPQPGQS